MRIELKRGIRNGYLILEILISALCVVLGYILLTALDKPDKIIFEDLCESVYTVYTQFGTLLFSSIIIIQFYNDYKEKNIIFYKALKRGAVSYFLQKVSAIIVGTVLGTTVSSLALCIPYGRLDCFFALFLKTEAVMIYYSLIMSIFGFAFENFLVAFFADFFYWLAGIILSTISPMLEIFAYYDDSTSDYTAFVALLGSQNIYGGIVHILLMNCIYDLTVFAIAVMLVFFLRRRWIYNGI